jgi:hypothetical protein
VLRFRLAAADRIFNKFSPICTRRCRKIFLVFRRAVTAILPRIPVRSKRLREFWACGRDGQFDSIASTAKIKLSLVEK